MYPNQPPQLYTTRHYNYNPQGNSPNYSPAPNYSYSRPPAQPYPYYTNNPPVTTVSYVNDRPNYTQGPPQYAPANSYQPPANNYQPPANNYQPPANNYQMRSSIMRPGPAGGGGIEKTNIMSSESPFHDPARPYENLNTSRTATSITAQPKSGGPVNKTLNLSDENPFHSVYGGYHYPSQIDPSKRITTQNTANRSTDNKSLNLSDENPFFATYGRYHYPSQIDPAKRITEMPKAAGPLLSTNELSDENPFSGYRPGPPPPQPNYYSGGYGSNSYSNAPQQSYRGPPPPQPPPQPSYRPAPNYQDQSNYPPARAPSPPRPQRQPSPVGRTPAPPPAPSAPLDKTSLNMSPDNPFAATYGQYHYPSPEEIKAQKRANERNARAADPVPGNNNRPVQPNNQMTEYPESEQKEVISGKGNSKFTRFDVNF